MKNYNYFILCFVMLFLVNCSNRNNKTPHSRSVYENVIYSGEIRCAYLVYPPATIKDPNTGELSGIFVDAFKRAASNMDLKINWIEEVGWGSMIEGLKTNRYDIVVCAIWPNATRGKMADFSIPLYYSGIGVYVRPDDNRFTASLSVINDPAIKISTMDGEINEVIARTQFPKAGTVSIPQLSDFNQILYNVSQGKADVTFVETYVGSQFLAANPNTIVNISKDKPFRITPNTFLMNKGEYDFKIMINTALEELINTGYIDELIDKYEKFPGSLYKINHPYRID